MSKKAVISTGGKQYIVAEGDELDIEHLDTADKTISFDVLLSIDKDKVAIGKPTVEGAKVTAQIVEPEIKSDKIIAIRYKAKKRVKKIRGHRQILTRVRITKIS